MGVEKVGSNYEANEAFDVKDELQALKSKLNPEGIEYKNDLLVKMDEDPKNTRISIMKGLSKYFTDQKLSVPLGSFDLQLIGEDIMRTLEEIDIQENENIHVGYHRDNNTRTMSVKLDYKKDKEDVSKEISFTDGSE